MLLAYLASLFLTYSVAQGVTELSARCVCDSHDRFDQPLEFTFGQFQGQCVDSCKFRGAVILRSSKDIWRVANVLHDEKFWTAEIPTQSVTEVDIAFERFFSIASHVFIRFRFAEPLALERQGHPGRQKISDIILSVEGAPPSGRRYSFLESSKGDYLLSYRLLSLPEAYTRMVLHLGHNIRQYRLDLTQEEMRDLLRTSLQSSMSQSFRSRYQLLSNNCASSAMTLIERASGQKLGDLSLFERLERPLPIEGPVGTLNMLESRGLISRSLANLENEIHLVSPRPPPKLSE